MMASSLENPITLYINAASVDSPDAHYGGLRPGRLLLPTGHRVAEDRAAFQVDSIFDRDIEVPMRDGIRLRADIFRPATSDSVEAKVPVIIAWSSYGKTGTGFWSLDLVTGRAGVPRSRTSGYEKWEGPDPAEWNARGYAICNIDARGAFDSEGNIRWLSSEEGEDLHDTIEYLAQLPWCNGAVTMMGNSWLAASQWFGAAQRPPHLKCIAPWEGATDVYRDIVCRGGVPSFTQHGLLQSKLFGRQKLEDIISMVREHPTWNQYWERKRAKVENIDIPAYVVASWSTAIHTEGTLRGYNAINGPKWLRIHATQEWFDIYSKEANDELQMFYDRYTKNIDNGWERTPKVRVSILGFSQPTLVNKPFSDWPIPNTRYQTFFFHSTGRLGTTRPLPSSAGKLSYRSDVPIIQADNDTEELAFEHTFDREVCLVGYPRATLYMAAEDHDDMDVFISVRKADQSGNILRQLNIPAEAMGLAGEEIPITNTLCYTGPTGIVRASHRALDVELSDPHHPVLSHRCIQKIQPGEVARLDVPIWPTAVRFSPGEKLIVKIAGHDLRPAEFPALYGTFTSGNKGDHTLYCGNNGYMSEIDIPFVYL